jgi:hypothetical protein
LKRDAINRAAIGPRSQGIGNLIREKRPPPIKAVRSAAENWIVLLALFKSHFFILILFL